MSYLNTKPLIYGFEKGMMKNELDLVIDYPSNIAQKLINDQIDVGLVPVAIIPSLTEYHIISDYCISCDGEVASVCLFSEVPLRQIDTILLDYQSRTSIALLKILLKEHWGISPLLIEGAPGYETTISDTTAGLVIGDRALHQRRHSTFIYDLGSAWKELTGLPFIFAAWISNKTLSTDFIDMFNDTNGFGYNNIPAVIELHPYDEFNLLDYYSTYIKFKPVFDKLEVITLFLKKLKALQ